MEIQIDVDALRSAYETSTNKPLINEKEALLVDISYNIAAAYIKGCKRELLIDLFPWIHVIRKDV